jgi:hypothetical protein
VKTRVKELIWVKGSEILPNPFNWRRHPREQIKAFKDLLDSIGFADVILVYENNPGEYTLIDGHMRTGLLQDEVIPAVVLDVSPDEAKVLVYSLDPIAEMAETNEEKVEEVLATVGEEVKRSLKDLPKWKKQLDSSQVLSSPPPSHPQPRKPRCVTCPFCDEEFEL